MRDLIYAIRSLRKTPGFTAIALFLLAVGIGSNLAVFSLIDPLFLRLPPIDQPQHVLQVVSVDKDGRTRPLFSSVMDPLRREKIFRGVCGFSVPSLATEINGILRSRRTLAMTGDCLSTLGIATQLGRPIAMPDDDRGAARVALLTDALWRTAFAGASDVVGKPLRVGGTVFTIVGVVEPRFTGFTPGFPTDLIIPLAQRPVAGPAAASQPAHFFVGILGRLDASASPEQVQARLGALARPLLDASVPARFPPPQRQGYLDRRIALRSIADGIETFTFGADRWVSDRFGRPLYAVWAICAVVMLVGCVNLAILFLGRGLARQREIAVRLALGATRASLVRLLALESVPLVLIGSALGVLLARALNHLVAGQAQDAFGIIMSPASLSPGLDLRTALFLTAMAVVVTSVFALVPVWQAGRLAKGSALKESGRGIAGSSTRTQKILLAVQVALTLALVSSSGLFTSSLRYIHSLDLGLQTRGVSVVTLADVPGERPMDQEHAAPYYADLVRQFESLSGVTAVSLSDYAPFSSRGDEAPVASADAQSRDADVRALTPIVSDTLFQTLGVPILAGSTFTPADREPTVVVSQSLAKRHGGARLIGQQIRVGETGSDRLVRVVGIAGDIHPSLAPPLGREFLIVYMNLWQSADVGAPFVLVKTQSGAPLPAADVRRVLASRGQHYVDDYRTLDQTRDGALIETRTLASLATGFGLLSLILAATGLFGLLNYHVTSRTNEIGVRMALGAARRQIHGHVLGQLVPVLAAGMAIGIGLTLALGRLTAGLVFGVRAQDPGLIALSVGILIATAGLAAFIPARRATSVNPVIALRQQ